MRRRIRRDEGAATDDIERDAHRDRAGLRRTPGRRETAVEIAIVLALSLGASAVYSLVSILNAATRPQTLSSQTTTLNRSLSDRPVFDLVYQLLSVAFDLVPVALVMLILWRAARPHLGRLGLDFSRVGRDTASGLGLALAIGVPGIGLYLAGRALGVSLDVQPTALGENWWTVPVLVLSALRAGLTEEVIVVGYLFARLRGLGWRPGTVIVATALLRGTYHAYQGGAGFVGNLAMGLLFGWLYSRFGRLLPLIVAHVVMDTAVFVGYPFAASAFPGLFASAG
jgi:membrane protease YdiL (CAAX protease family)